MLKKLTLKAVMIVITLLFMSAANESKAQTYYQGITPEGVYWIDMTTAYEYSGPNAAFYVKGGLMDSKKWDQKYTMVPNPATGRLEYDSKLPHSTKKAYLFAICFIDADGVAQQIETLANDRTDPDPRLSEVELNPTKDGWNSKVRPR